MRSWQVPGMHVPIDPLFLDEAVCGYQVFVERGTLQGESRLLRLLDPFDQGSLSTSWKFSFS